MRKVRLDSPWSGHGFHGCTEEQHSLHVAEDEDTMLSKFSRCNNGPSIPFRQSHGSELHPPLASLLRNCSRSVRLPGQHGVRIVVLHLGNNPNNVIDIFAPGASHLVRGSKIRRVRLANDNNGTAQKPGFRKRLRSLCRSHTYSCRSTCWDAEFCGMGGAALMLGGGGVARSTLRVLSVEPYCVYFCATVA